MDCHINNNTLMRVFRDQDIFKHRAPISKIIQTDDHANCVNTKKNGKNLKYIKHYLLNILYEMLLL